MLTPKSFDTLIEHAVESIHTALHTAQQQLPAAVRTQAWIRKKTSPAPWRSVEQWYHNQVDADYTAEIARTLSHIVRLADAKEQLLLVLQDIETADRVPNLTLPKVRRPSI